MVFVLTTFKARVFVETHSSKGEKRKQKEGSIGPGPDFQLQQLILLPGG